MSTAVQPTTIPPPSASATHAGLVIASVVGALVVLAGAAIAGYLVPKVWDEYLAPATGQLPGFLNLSLRLLFQLGAIVAVVYAGVLLAGTNPPRGLRGGIFLVVALAVSIFIAVSIVHSFVADFSYGMSVSIAVMVALLFGAYRVLMSARAETKMHTLEAQGWFHPKSFKATQGLKLRRYTMVGILIVGWSGAWSLWHHRALGYGDLILKVPFVESGLAVLPSKEITVPLLIALAVGWFAWRLVNVPVFADFLIATEAEMNKVSWSTRKRLMQDTVVVLITVVILTTFLLIVDLFWGWLLSRSFIGVLPNKPTENKQAAGDTLKW